MPRLSGSVSSATPRGFVYDADLEPARDHNMRAWTRIAEHVGIGRRYGKWTVTGAVTRRGSHAYVESRCSCGETRSVKADAIVRGRSLSCGHERRRFTAPKIGDQYGRLHLLAVISRSGAHETLWLCCCICGTEVVKTRHGIAAGKTKSCGCYKIKHGDAAAPEYKLRARMIQRCHSPQNSSFERYGGRGITVCKRWRDSYSAFLADVGRKPSREHSLDRIDNNGNYEPGNVRWATRKEQMRNTRANRRLTFNGRTLTCAEWAEVLGINTKTLSGRLHRGWSVAATLSGEKGCV